MFDVVCLLWKMIQFSKSFKHRATDPSGGVLTAVSAISTTLIFFGFELIFLFVFPSYCEPAVFLTALTERHHENTG